MMRIQREDAGRLRSIPFLCVLGVILYAGIVSAATAQTANTGAAQAYPTKPVRLIIPFPPGGSNDIVGRYIGSKLAEQLGRQVVVDNRAGADGIIGSEIAARAQPDGHTLLVISTAFPMNAGIPAAIVSRLNAEIAAIMALPETQKRFASEGAEPRVISPAEFGKLIATEITKWTRVAREAGIRVE